MPSKPPSFSSKAQRERSAEIKRAHSHQSTAIYDQRWRKLRAVIIAQEPLCRRCALFGRTTEAQIVHHIVGVHDAPDLVLEPSNLAPVCRQCHDDIHAEEGTHGGGTVRRVTRKTGTIPG